MTTQKKIEWIYSIIAALVAMYIHLNVPDLVYFVFGSALTFIFLRGLLVCVTVFLKARSILKIVDVVVFTSLLIAVYFAYVLAHAITQIGCTVCPPPVVGKSYLTGETKTYENGTPPWHVKVVEVQN